MAYARITMLLMFFCSTILLQGNNQLTHEQLTSINVVASSVGICGALYYYLMLHKEQKLHQQQESFINQLILDQDINPELRESIRTLIKRCTVSIKKYSTYKNIAILPLLICAAGLGYTAGKSD